MITTDALARGLRPDPVETTRDAQALARPATEALGFGAMPISEHYQDLPFSPAAWSDLDLAPDQLRQLLAIGGTGEIIPASQISPQPVEAGTNGLPTHGGAFTADHLLREVLQPRFWQKDATPFSGPVALGGSQAGADMPQTAANDLTHQVRARQTPDPSNMLGLLVALPLDDMALQRALDGWPSDPMAVAAPPVQIPNFIERPAAENWDRSYLTLGTANQAMPRPPDANGFEQHNALIDAARRGFAPGIADMMQQGGGGFSSIELEALRADFPILHQQVNGYPLTWLDNAATTQKPRQVTDALTTYYHRDNSNVHRGAHALAARATDAYENARATVHRLLKSKSAQEIVFVRGTTEGINLVAQSYARSVLGPGDEVVVTTLEHHSNIVPWQMVCRERGAVLRPAPITDIGEVDLNAYMRMLGPKTRIVALAHVSNVLGTVLPVREMTAMAHAVNARVLIDGAQAIAHMPVDVCSIGCDFYTFSGHKIFGPTGVGALYGRRELLDAMPPWQGGGSMIDRVRFEESTYAAVPAKFEAGTGILAGAVGLGAAIDYVQKVGLERIAQHEHALLQSAMTQLSAIPGLRLYGKAPNKAAVAAFLIDGVEPERVGRFLDSRGIAVRVGHHCAQPTMDRYGVRGMVRPSFAFYNTFDEIDRLVAALYELKGTSH
jgi:cysteine desulfurase / selenocysteine lyase